jgi:hypothetical protein
MNFNKVYIISWFGEGPMVEKRMKMHDNQLQWCLENDLKPVVFAQNYKEEYYRPNVTYIKHYGQVLRFGEAREHLLKLFYNSDDDFAVFADNDAYLYKGPKYGANDTFVSTMRSVDIKQFNQIDCFYPINPAFVPFSKDLIKNKITDEYSWRMKPGYIAAQFFVLKNLKKHYNKEIYYDPAFVLPDRSILPAEDQEFPINLIHNGLTCFQCPNLIKKDEGLHNNSTWSPSDKEAWANKTLAGLNYIAEKYNLPKLTKLVSSSVWMKHLKLRNEKMKETQVYFKPSTFYDLFDVV